MVNFNRYVKIQVTYIENIGGLKKPDLNNQKTFIDNRITFHIQNTYLGDYGLATFNLYNLSADSITFIQGGGRELLLTCWAGYDDSQDNLIFEGQVTNVINLRQGVDTVSMIYVRDGQLLGELSPRGLNFPKDETRIKLLDRLKANNVDLHINYLEDSEATLKADTTVLPAFASVGTYSQIVPKILGAEYQISFYSGQINIRNIRRPDELGKIGSDISQKTVSLNSGLIQYPTVTYYNLTFKHMLDSIFKPGAIITIDPKTVQIKANSNFYERAEDFLSTEGTFRIMGVEHDGDNRDSVWSSEVEAFAVG